MAAVVASLVAFAAGLPLVAPAGTYGAAADQQRDQLGSGSNADEHLQVWTAADPEQLAGATNPGANAGAGGEVKGGHNVEGSASKELQHRRSSINGRLAQLANSIAFIKAAGVQGLLSWESGCAPTPSGKSASDGAAEVACWEEGTTASTSPISAFDVHDESSRAVTVKFDLQLNTEHEVTPYSEVYGLHPKDFNFARGSPLSDGRAIDPFIDPFTIVPVLKHRPAREDSDDEDEGTLSLKGRGLRALGVYKSMPWPFWFVGCIVILLLRALGSDLYDEFLQRL